MQQHSQSTSLTIHKPHYVPEHVISNNIEEGFEVSIYGKGSVQPEVILPYVAKLKMAFPNLGQEFFDVLLERIKSLPFTNERAIAAINHVIDTEEYPRFQLSRILSFDTKYKLYTYAHVLRHVHNGGKFNDYVSVTRSGRKFWVEAADFIRYDIPKEL